MTNSKDRFSDEEIEISPVLKSINMLCAMTEYNLSSASYVRQAFLLGLWHESFPEYMLGNVERAHWWDYSKGFDEAGQSPFDSPYSNLQRFQFVADTGDSWHQCYRELRRLGWERLKVYREGGRLQYLLKRHRLSMPPGFRDVHLILDISISTCKQVQVGTELKEVPVMKTVCEDLIELVEEVASPSEASPRHIQMSGICMPGCPKCAIDNPEPRCDHEPDPSRGDFKDDMPF